MNSGFDSALIKLRNDTKKYGNDRILITRVNESSVEFSGINWVRKIECPIGGFIMMLQVGYLINDKKEELNLFLEQKVDSIELKINQTILLKKYKGKGINSVLPRLFLIGGIIILLISGFLFFTNSESSGFAQYSRSGNSLMGNNYAINWFHAFILGIGLIFMFILTKLYGKNKN
jgi:hypothetical protein